MHLQYLIFGLHLLTQVLITDLLDFYLGLKLSNLGVQSSVLFLQLKNLLLVALHFRLLHWHIVLFELFLCLAQHKFSLAFLKVLLSVLLCDRRCCR